MGDQNLEERNYQLALKEHERQHGIIEFTARAANESAIIAMRALLFVNGGAVVTLLAFVGAIEAGENFTADTTDLISSMLWFAYGVGTSVVTSFIAYLVFYFDNTISAAKTFTWEHPYTVETQNSRLLLLIRNALHVLGVIAAIASLAFFFLGIRGVSSAVGALNL